MLSTGAREEKDKNLRYLLHRADVYVQEQKRKQSKSINNVNRMCFQKSVVLL